MITPVPPVSETEKPYCEIGNLRPSGGREVKESESDDDDVDIMTIRENTRVNHRMDFATGRDLTDVIDDPELENVVDWGFADRTLADDLA